MLASPLFGQLASELSVCLQAHGEDLSAPDTKPARLASSSMMRLLFKPLRKAGGQRVGMQTSG
jgi:hypothetical protein